MGLQVAAGEALQERAEGSGMRGQGRGGPHHLRHVALGERTPTLLVGAEWDRDTPPYMAQTLFPLLMNSPGKRYVALAEGTHTIIMERNRLKLFEAVQAFLDEAKRS